MPARTTRTRIVQKPVAKANNVMAVTIISSPGNRIAMAPWRSTKKPEMICITPVDT